MKRATLTETKNNLSKLIDQVKAGETILVTERGRPVARIESVLDENLGDEDRLVRLERAGIVRRPIRNDASEILKQPPPRPASGRSVVDVLIEERRGGR